MSRPYDRVPPSGSTYYQGSQHRETYPKQATHPSYQSQPKIGEDTWEQSWQWSVEPETSTTSSNESWYWPIDKSDKHTPSQIHNNKNDQYKKWEQPHRNENAHQQISSQQFKHKQVTQNNTPTLGYQEPWQPVSQGNFATSQNVASQPSKDVNFQETSSTWHGSQYPNAQVSAYGTQQHNIGHQQMTWHAQQEQQSWNKPATSQWENPRQNVEPQYSYKPNIEAPPQNWNEPNANNQPYWNQGDPNWNTPQPGWNPAQQGMSTFDYSSPQPKEMPQQPISGPIKEQGWYESQPKRHQTVYDYQNKEVNQIYQPENLTTLPQNKKVEQPTYQDQYYGMPTRNHTEVQQGMEGTVNAYGKEPNTSKDIRYEQDGHDIGESNTSIQDPSPRKIDMNTTAQAENKENIYVYEKENSPHHQHMTIDHAAVPEQRNDEPQSLERYLPVKNKESFSKSQEQAAQAPEDYNQEVIAPPPPTKVVSNIRISDPDFAPNAQISYAAAVNSEVQQKGVQPEAYCIQQEEVKPPVQPSTPEPLEDQSSIDDAPNQEVPIGSALIQSSREISLLEQTLGLQLSLDLPENLEKPEDVESLSKSWALRSQMRAPILPDSPSASLLDSTVELPTVLLVASLPTHQSTPPPPQDEIKVIQDAPAGAPSEKEKPQDQAESISQKAQLLENLQNLGIEEIPTTREKARAQWPGVDNSSPVEGNLAPSSVNPAEVAENKVIEYPSRRSPGSEPTLPQNAEPYGRAIGQMPKKAEPKVPEAPQKIMESRHEPSPTIMPYAAQQDDVPQRNAEKSREPGPTTAHQRPAPQRNVESSRDPSPNDSYAIQQGMHSTPQRHHSRKSPYTELSAADPYDTSPQHDLKRRGEPGGDVRRHSLEESPRRAKGGTDYAPVRRDSFDSQFSYRTERPDAIDSRYEDHKKDERRPRHQQDPRYEGPGRFGRESLDGDYNRSRPFDSHDRHAFEESYHYPSKSRYYKQDGRDRRKYGYEEEYYSDLSRPSSRASIDERYSKDPQGHFRSATPSVMSESERGADFYDSRSNYERRYKHGNYYPPYQDSYGYHYYPPMDQHSYYASYYPEYYRQYGAYYQRPQYEGDYSSQYYGYPQQRRAEEYPPQSLAEEVSKYSQDIERSSVAESEVSIPSVHSERLFSPRANVSQVDGGVTLGTYVKFQSSHCIARFTPTGKLLMVMPSNLGRPQVEFHDLQHFLANDETYQQLKSFPGPLVKGKTFKNEVLQICQRRLKRGTELGADIQDPDSYVLLWKFIIKLLKQSGNIDGSDVADLLLEEQQQVSHHSSQQQLGSAENLSQSPSSENLAPPPSSFNKSGGLTQDEITAKFREFLLYGNKTEALEFAMKNLLWGHALFLASKMDAKVHSKVLTRFANSLPLNDPLQTLYQLMSNRQPAAMTCLADETWGDWRPHLAMVLSNPTQNQLSRSSIISLAETLYSQGQIHAAHFCYLLVQEYGCYPTKSNKVVLIGTDNSLPFEHFASLGAIQWTEIYEYALSLAAASEGEILQHLVPFKLHYANLLIDYGFIREAFNYLEVIADSTTNKFQLTLVYDIANKIRCFDPSMDADEMDWMDTLWNKLYGTGQMADTASASERSSLQHLEENLPLDPPPMSEDASLRPSLDFNPPEVMNHHDYQAGTFDFPKQESAQEAPLPEIESGLPTIPQYSPVSTPSLISEPTPNISQSSLPPSPVKIPPPAINPPPPSQFNSTTKLLPVAPQSEKKKPEKKRPPPPSKQTGSSWLGGIFSKLLPKAPNQMILPDDKNPTIVYDNEKKMWINTAPENEENNIAQAPPIDQELNQKLPDLPPPPGGMSKYSRPKTNMMGSNYVNVNSQDVFTLAKKPELPPEFQMVSAPPPQATAFFNPADFSSRTAEQHQAAAPSTTRNPYSKRAV